MLGLDGRHQCNSTHISAQRSDCLSSRIRRAQLVGERISAHFRFAVAAGIRRVQCRPSLSGSRKGHEKVLFPSRQLPMGPSGWMEPLLPPFRHSDHCFKQTSKTLLDLTFLVHDFGAICRNLKRTSRTVLVDMGASLDFFFTMQTTRCRPCT
jgi:hypothetical protein